MSEHTKEPWSIDKYGAATDKDGKTILVTGFALNCGRSDKTAEANARRIVACVNALEGVPTEALVTLAENFRSTNPFDLWTRYCTAKDQRDELVVALDAIRRTHYPAGVLDIADAALAKVGAGKGDGS